MRKIENSGVHLIKIWMVLPAADRNKGLIQTAKHSVCYNSNSHHNPTMEHPYLTHPHTCFPLHIEIIYVCLGSTNM